MLFSYAKQVRRFINDDTLKMVDEENLVSYINRARRMVAERTQCIRFVPPIVSSITSANVTAAGSSYTAPTVVISPPDYPPGVTPYPAGAQATGTANVTAGQISGVQITYGGAGYFQPLITISDPTGSGATVVPVQTAMNLLLQNQEVYPFSAVSLADFPGVASILFVRSVSVIYANFRYSLPKYSFSAYQARVRNYPFQYEYVPTVFSQFGQGAGGSLYMYPIPSQTYQQEWDCCGIPSDLDTDQDVEAIPDPWRDPVVYFATSLAYAQMQNFNAATYYDGLFDKFVARYSAYARPGRVSNPYGRP